ncbi:MAG: helix-turn-helix transcriptional regulator [Anaerolineae bacterium]|nr:helix-turn-helix transcriptional regulator [Anaerolineae bacterium]
MRHKMAGLRLRALRERFDLSLEETGQALGLSAEEVLDRELGAEPLQVGDLWRLCHYLGVLPADAYAIQAEPGGRPLDGPMLRIRRKLLGAALAERRQERGLSRAEAAEQAGLSEGWLRGVELGQAELDLAQLELLAWLYRCRPETVLGTEKADEGRKRPQPPAELPSNALATDVAEFLRRPDAERYVRAAMALSVLEAPALAALEDALLFLRGSA